MKSLNAFPCSSNAGARLRSGSAGRKGEVTTNADIEKYPPGFCTGQAMPDLKAYPILKKKPATRYFIGSSDRFRPVERLLPFQQ
jgi:hypothetical protein